jgi:hypothetical protein
MRSRTRLEDSFDRELGLAARSLVTESLPRGVLEQPEPGTGSPDARRLLAIAVVVVVLVLVAGVGAGLLQRTRPEQAPVLRSTSQIELDFRALGYVCRNGPTASPAIARAEALMCASPASIHPVVATLIASDDAAGMVVTIKVKAGILGTPNTAAETGRRFLLELLVALVFVDTRDEAEARAWIRANALLGAGQEVRTTIHGLAAVLDRDATGGYEVELGSTPPASAPSAATG